VTRRIWIPSGIAVLALYLLRLDRVAGMIVDDAWYAVLARALAEGRGYRLISSAAAEILPMYPPGFPALLAGVFKVTPDFPQNVWLLKSVSIAAMGGVAVFTFRYLVAYRSVPRGLALGVAVAAAVTPAFVFLATSTLMSDCVFTALQLLAVLLVERAAAAPDASRWRATLIAAGVAALTILTRTAGVAVVAGAVLYFAIGRRWGLALIYVAATGVLLAPWALYAKLHEPTVAERLAHGGQLARSYSAHFWRSADGMGATEVTLRDLPERIQRNAWNVLSRDVGGIIIPSVFRGPAESGQEVIALGPASKWFPASMGNTSGTVLLSVMLGAVALFGFVTAARRRLTISEFLVPLSLAITIAWPFWTFRFVLPLAPFLLFYLLEGVRALALPAARVVIVSIVALNVIDHVSYILQDRGIPGGVAFHQDFDEVESVLTWMRANVHGDGAVASDNPALVFLYTGRKAVATDNVDANWQNWKALGIRYIVIIGDGSLPGRTHDYRVLFRSRAGYSVIEMS
jgi:hypothetical protein